jgi:hypothetical protein
MLRLLGVTAAAVGPGCLAAAGRECLQAWAAAAASAVGVGPVQVPWPARTLPCTVSLTLVLWLGPMVGLVGPAGSLQGGCLLRRLWMICCSMLTT